MPNLKVLHPVHTLDKRLLFATGTTVSDETLGTLISSDRSGGYQSYPLLNYKSIRADLIRFLSPPPFNVIFSDQNCMEDIFGIIDHVNLPIPFLDSLDYFKDHDFYTYRHILVVCALSTLLARDLIPDYEARVHHVATSPTHDIGKVCVPVSILKKSSPLTKKERVILMNHTTAGYVLSSYYLKDMNHMSARVARDHHERKDGSGHPRGIELNDPVVEIIAVCDVYDALISPRPYRPVSFDNRTALEEITAMAEMNRINWEVVKALIAHNRKDKPLFENSTVSLEKRGTPPENNIYGLTADDEASQ